MALSGSDLSSNNSAATVNEAMGKAFVIVKASQGLGYVWTAGQAVAQRARDAGLLVGWYHYAVVKNDPAAEATAFVKAANARPGEVLALDYEPYGDQLVNGAPPVLVDWILTFAQTVTAQTGAPCWFYTNASLGAAVRAKATADQSAALSRMPLWKAYYQPDHGNFMGWPEIACWQYSADGGLDKNTFYGDAARWRQLAVPQEDDMPGLLPEERKIIDELLNIARTARRDGDTKVWPFQYTPEDAILQQVQAVAKKVDALAVPQIDYAALAKAVNDDAAKRMQS